MAILNIFNSKKPQDVKSNQLGSFLQNFSIEVMPRTAAKIENFNSILPKKTRVYIAHLEGVSIDDMLSTAKRINHEGYEVVPHLPARIIESTETLEKWLKLYSEEANVENALLLAGGVVKPIGNFKDSMQLVETGLFDKYNFKKLYFAGHPEGNKDIDPDGSSKNIARALKWKQDLNDRTSLEIALTTQFCFDPKPVIDWANDLATNGIDLPINIGVAGPAKLQTLIKFSIACGVGPSLKVLQKRAKDIKKLLLPFQPKDFLEALANHKHQNPQFGISSVHFFPLGGINATASWIADATKN